MAIKIRLAKKQDVSKLTKYTNKNHELPLKWARGRIEYCIKDHFIIIADDTDKKELAGVTFFYTKENPILGVGELEGVQIAEDYRGQGIGNKMIKRVVQESKNYFKRYNSKLYCLYLFTRSSNKTAIKLYEKLGFEKQATIGKIFRANQPDELVMTRFFD